MQYEGGKNRCALHTTCQLNYRRSRPPMMLWPITQLKLWIKFQNIIKWSARIFANHLNCPNCISVFRKDMNNVSILFYVFTTNVSTRVLRMIQYILKHRILHCFVGHIFFSMQWHQLALSLVSECLRNLSELYDFQNSALCVFCNFKNTNGNKLLIKLARLN